MEQKLKQAFNTLFSRARERGGLEFIHTLVRTSSYDCRPIEDPFLKMKRLFERYSGAAGERQAAELYCEVATDCTPLDTIANLIRCEKGELYRIFPFRMINTEPSWQQVPIKASELAGQLEEADHTDLAEAVRAAYAEEALYACADANQLQAQSCALALNVLRPLLTALFEVYESERMSFLAAPRYQRYPRGVIEFLINDEFGIYGWKMHQPHRATPYFERRADGMDGENYMFNLDSEIQYWTTQLEPAGGVWRIQGKRLHELGLIGRYNSLGVWQPILYPAEQEDLQVLLKEVESMSSDPDVVGALFYIYATGFRTLEFVVRTNIDLPYEMGTVGDRIHLWKCPVSTDQADGTGERLYDGWVQLDSVEAEDVRSAIAAVGVVVNRLAFAYDASLAWRVKYRLTPSSAPLAKPSVSDLEIFNKLLIGFPKGVDAVLLEASLDWYRHARVQANPLSAFFGYYVAVERVAIAIHDGKANFGLGYRKKTKNERREEQDECIRQKHEELYSIDPQKFVREAYFQCIVGLGKKVRNVAELILGTDHQYVSALFDKVDGYSLSDIRSEIAHGGLSQANRDHLELVGRRLPEMAEVAKEFLARLCFGKKAGETLPDWSRGYIDERPSSDPRTFIATGDVEFVFSNDWTIQPHWCGI